MTKCWPDLSTPAVARPCPSNWSNVVPPTTSRTGLPSAPYTDTSPLSNFHVAYPDPPYEITKFLPDLSTPAIARPCPSNWSNVVPPPTSRTGLPSFLFNDTAPFEIFPLSPPDALPVLTKCWPDLSTPAVARPCPSNWSNVVPPTTSRTGLPSAPYTDTSPLSN